MDALRQKIEELLDNKVRPQLALHGGGIETLCLAEGIYTYRLLGQCANCPSAYLGTEEMIRQTLLSQIPELHQVELEQIVSDDLLAQARNIMHCHG